MHIEVEKQYIFDPYSLPPFPYQKSDVIPRRSSKMPTFSFLLSFSLPFLPFIFCQNITTTLQLSTTPGNASSPIPESFVSFSIEFAFFPDFTGTVDNPNTLSYNLLSSIANLTGSFPVIRVGGNTQ